MHVRVSRRDWRLSVGTTAKKARARGERVLEDDDGALETYRQITGQTRNTGSAEYYYGVQGAARILTRRGEFDEALKVLNLVDAERLSGGWRGSMLLALGETLAAAGRKDEALKAFRDVLEDESAEAGNRQRAEERIKALNSPAN